MTYESWRITYQSSEAAARAAFDSWRQRTKECDALIAAAKVSVDIGMEIEAELTVTRAKLAAAEAHIAVLEKELDEKEAQS